MSSAKATRGNFTPEDLDRIIVIKAPRHTPRWFYLPFFYLKILLLGILPLKWQRELRRATPRVVCSLLEKILYKPNPAMRTKNLVKDLTSDVRIRIRPLSICHRKYKVCCNRKLV